MFYHAGKMQRKLFSKYNLIRKHMILYILGVMYAFENKL